MIELVIASMGGVSVWIASRLVARRDPVIMQRVSQLAASSGRARAREGRLPRRALETVGGRFRFNLGVLEQLMTAGGVTHFNLYEVNGLRVLGAFVGVLIGMLFGGGSVIAMPLLGIAAFKFPELVMRGRASRRREEIAAELPDVVDLLSVCTGAGLNIALSLTRVADASSGALGDELRRSVSQIDLGVPRREALAEFVSRNDVEDLEALVSMIVGAERFGTQLGPSLANFATEVRSNRRRRAEEQARRAPVKMLFPLVFLILPGFILLTLVPLVLSTFQSLGL